MKERNPSSTLIFRLAGMGFVLYWYYEILRLYQQGGEEAPSLLFLILSGIVLVGGALALGIISVRGYLQEIARQKEAAAQAAREEDQGENDNENSEDRSV